MFIVPLHMKFSSPPGGKENFFFKLSYPQKKSSLVYYNFFSLPSVFAMVKIRRIGDDHHALFQVVVALVIENQAVARGENKLRND